MISDTMKSFSRPVLRSSHKYQVRTATLEQKLITVSNTFYWSRVFLRNAPEAPRDAIEIFTYIVPEKNQRMSVKLILNYTFNVLTSLNEDIADNLSYSVVNKNNFSLQIIWKY